ncbi:MAG: pilus assembly protein PilM, partial [Nitrospinota bacterium]
MIKNALLHASLTLNGLEKKIGFFEKFQPSKTLAIYLGHRTVDILQVEKGYLGHKTVLARSFTNPFTHFDEANPEGETSFKEELNGFLRRSDRDWDEVVLGLPRSLVTFKKVSIPAPEKNMIPDVLSFEIEKHIPFNPSDALYDYKVFGESKEKVYSVFISIIKKNIVDFYLGLLGSIGLVPTIVDISTCSILNALFFHDVDSTILN